MLYTILTIILSICLLMNIIEIIFSKQTYKRILYIRSMKGKSPVEMYNQGDALCRFHILFGYVLLISYVMLLFTPALVPALFLLFPILLNISKHGIAGMVLSNILYVIFEFWCIQCLVQVI